MQNKKLLLGVVGPSISNMVAESESQRYTLDGTVDLRGRPVLASRTGKWKACAFLIGYEAFERMAFISIGSNLVNYLSTQLHEDTVASIRNVTNWSGSVWITPIVGAYIADAYLGRFWTFTISSLIYVTGMILLTMAVSLKSLRPTCKNGVCGKATTSQVAFFYSALYVIAAGAGGTKPNISTFGGDQFDDFDPQEKKMKISFFNWWVFGAFTGSLVATLGLVYIQENLGWGLGYGIPSIGLVLSLIVFYLGMPMYRHKARTAESPIRDLLCVPIAAFRKRHHELSGDPSELHEVDPSCYIVTGNRQLHHTPVFRFLDKAALKECAVSPPLQFTVTQVERVKLIWGMFSIWLTTLIPSMIWAQSNTLFVKQGTTLDRTIDGGFRIPSASLGSFVTLSMLVCIPIYDRLFVPFMQQRTGKPRGITLLQRLGIGFLLQIVAISVASAVEAKRMDVIANNHITAPKDVVPMSILWLLPQNILLGIADVFNAIGVLEFFYDQSPSDMESLGTTFFTSSIAVGNFMNSFLVTVVDGVTAKISGKSWIGNNLNDSRLDCYYAFLVLLSTLNLCAFLWASNNYVYKREETVVDGCVETEVKADSDKPFPELLQT